MKTMLFSTGLGLLLAGSAAQAQLKLEISGVGANQIPIAVANFADDSGAPQHVADIIRADLARSGLFKLIEANTVVDANGSVNYGDWKAKGADALVAGSVTRLADGRYDVRYRLLDTIKNAPLSASANAAPEQALRLQAHKIADDIFQKLTGERGVFATRIAYVSKRGKQYMLEVADADGQGNLPALSSTEPIISPTWSPDGTKLAYVSFEMRKPVVYVQNLVTTKRTIVANYKGNNSAPAWSPDGNHLAVALTRDGLTQIYMVNADGSGLRRLTHSSGIDTEPRFSPDGQSIYFTSDRSGGPQIYRMSVAGGEAQRITFGSNYNISPRISPDGKTLAFISRREGKFQLYTLDLASGQEVRLGDTHAEESPSFAPNGKYLMYATEAGRRGSLAVVSLDGRVKQRLNAQAGDIREPAWGPFMP
ncbi:Tol-Pal system beta propeller repeat protein TolB [Massilia sp. W12]|uniref:Tol-Pal system beta propeller repeat protein TolB n=1 Tax=Massilia sp. W12 TaxID=3126507 RepID=UPI0030CCBCEB